MYDFLYFNCKVYEIVADDMKKDLSKQIAEMKLELDACKSEIVHDNGKARKGMEEVLTAIRDESKNIKGEIDIIKNIVQKILQIVVDIRYKVDSQILI